MFDLDRWNEIYQALTKNKLRTILTAFGVFWGILMLIILLGAGKGLENGIISSFTGFATNSLYLWGQSTSKAYAGFNSGRNIELHNNDVEALRQLESLEVVAPRLQLGGYRGGHNVMRGDKAGAFSVNGDYPIYMRISPLKILEGRFVNQLDIQDKRKTAVIGTRVAELLFEPGEDPIGKWIQINQVSFQVVGIFETYQSGERAERDLQTIYIPFTTFQRAFNYGDRVGWIAILSDEDVPADVAEQEVVALLGRRHKVHPEDTRAFGYYNAAEEFGKMQGLFLGIRMLVWVVGIGTLIAGVIGVSNIMLIIVKERTKEIGIRRALGATPISIVSEIILESVILTSVAGYFGLAAGIFLLELMNQQLGGGDGGTTMFRNPEVSLTIALQALAVLVVSGALAGLIPARRALAVQPVEALRAE